MSTYKLFLFNDTVTTEIYPYRLTLYLHGALSAFFLKRAAVSLTVPLGLTRAICLAIDSLGSVGAVIACSTDAKRESISCCLITFLVALTTRFCQVPSDFFSRFLRASGVSAETGFSIQLRE